MGDLQEQMKAQARQLEAEVQEQASKVQAVLEERAEEFRREKERRDAEFKEQQEELGRLGVEAVLLPPGGRRPGAGHSGKRKRKELTPEGGRTSRPRSYASYTFLRDAAQTGAEGPPQARPWRWGRWSRGRRGSTEGGWGRPLQVQLRDRRGGG